MRQGVAKSQVELAGVMWRHMHPKRKRLPRPLAPRHPVGIERDYLRDILRFIQFISEQFYARVMPLIEVAANEQQQNKRADSVYDDLHEAFKNLRLTVEEVWSEERIAAMAKAKGVSAAEWQKKHLARSTQKVVGIVPFFPDTKLADIMSQFAVTNANLITSMGREAIAKMETTAMVSLQQGTRAETISKAIRDQINPSVSNIRARANLIARDQIAKLNGQLMKTRQEEIGITRYVWKTVGDGRVRDEHRLLHNQVFSWDNPPDVGHPGEDYQCRCYAEPYLADLIPGIEGSTF